MKYRISLILLLFATGSFAQSKEKYDIIYDSLSRTDAPKKITGYFLKELKTKPTNEFVLRRLGYLYAAAEQPETAEKYYRDALAVNPKCAHCYLNIGKLYANKQQFPKALELFDKAIGLAPADAELYAARAQLKEAMGDKFGAMADCDKAIAKDPANADYYIQRSDINTAQGFYLAALTDINKAIQLAPQHYYPYFKRSFLYYGKQQMSQALADMTMAIQLDSTRFESYLGRGTIYAAMNEHYKAIDDYNKAALLKPKDYTAYYNRSLEKYALEDMDGSCADIQACYAILQKYNPGDPLKEELDYSIGKYCDSSHAGYYYQRGIAWYNLQQYQKAVDIYTAGVTKFPTNAMNLSFRGNAYFMLKDYAHALPDYYASIVNKANLAEDIKANQKHTQVDLSSIDAYINRMVAGMYLNIAEAKFAMAQYDSALTAANTGIALLPTGTKETTEENYYYVRGNIWLGLGKYPEAIKDFDAAVMIRSTFAAGYVNRAIAKVNMTAKVKMTAYFISGGFNSQGFTPNWSMPLKSTIKKTDANLLSALADCNTAIAIEPGFNFAYYIRGQVKGLLQYNDYCADLLKAKALGYPVEPELLKGCEK